jgi:hypothetical protein
MESMTYLLMFLILIALIAVIFLMSLAGMEADLGEDVDCEGEYPIQSGG